MWPGSLEAGDHYKGELALIASVAKSSRPCSRPLVYLLGFRCPIMTAIRKVSVGALRKNALMLTGGTEAYWKSVLDERV